MIEKLKINRKLLKELDISIIVSTIVILLFGAINIYSATYMKSGIHFFKFQIIWLCAGLVLLYLILCFDYFILKGFANIIYWFGVFLLILNDFVFKHTVNGASSWMKIGPISLQPSEFAKLGIIIILAKLLDDMEGNINEPKNFFTLVFYAALPMLLVVIQPDMGMTMVYFFVVLGIFFAAGLNRKVIIGGLSSLVGLIAIVWNSPLMQAYWKERLLSFLNPELDELGSGMQLIQSKIGIGSGGIIGKGFLKGTQIAGQFIPESHTDFIFSVVGEEWGFLGAMFLLALYALLMYKFIKIAMESKDLFGRVICVGIISSFLFSIYQNIGMTIGIMPITGITLPLMSYGGSSVLTTFMSIGLILNIGMRRKKINF